MGVIELPTQLELFRLPGRVSIYHAGPEVHVGFNNMPTDIMAEMKAAGFVWRDGAWVGPVEKLPKIIWDLEAPRVLKPYEVEMRRRAQAGP
jgi:hypothetical protein